MKRYINQNKVFSVGIIGYGYIGKRHSAMIENNENFQLTCICDVNEKEKNNSTKKYNFYSDYKEMLDKETGLDLVVISSPNGFHEDHAYYALKKNNHVIIEKPMALTSKGCSKILDISKLRDKKIFNVMQNRYSPPSEWFKDVMKNNLLGEVYMVQINCFWNRDERYYKPDPLTNKLTTWHGTKEFDGGTLYTQFSHFIDLMFWFFGDVINVKSKIKDFNHKNLTEFEDSGTISFDFKNGGIGSFNFSTSVFETNLESSISVIAENGTVKIGGQYMNEVELCNIKNYTMPKLKKSNPPNDYGPYKGSAANHHYIYENINKVLRFDDEITTPGYDGYKVVEIIEKFYNN